VCVRRLPPSLAPPPSASTLPNCSVYQTLHQTAVSTCRGRSQSLTRHTPRPRPADAAVAPALHGTFREACYVWRRRSTRPPARGRGQRRRRGGLVERAAAAAACRSMLDISSIDEHRHISTHASTRRRSMPCPRLSCARPPANRRLGPRPGTGAARRVTRGAGCSVSSLIPPS
jgi:hypothetical protein